MFATHSLAGVYSVGSANRPYRFHATTHSLAGVYSVGSANRPYRFHATTHEMCGRLIGNRRTSRHKIGGTVSVEGQPAKRMVVAVSKKTFSFVAATTSHPVTGEWVIQGIEEHPERSLIVFAIDRKGEYNAEVADFITQVSTNPVLPTEAETPVG